MNLTVKPYRTVHQIKTNQKTQKNNSELAFTGIKKNVKLTTTLSAFAASALAAVGIKQKNTQIQKAASKRKLTPYERAEKEAPNFVNALKSMKHKTINDKGRKVTVPDFSNDTIVVLHRENKKNPKLSYELVNYVRSKSLETIDAHQTEIILQALKQRPQTLKERYYPGEPEQTSKFMDIYNYENSAEMYEVLDNLGKNSGKRFKTDEIDFLVDAFVLYPEKTIKLINLKDENGLRKLEAEEIFNLCFEK